MRLMRSKWLWALVAAISAVSLYAGKVLATPQMGVMTTILAKSLFHEIDLKARARVDDGDNDDRERRHHDDDDEWQARLKTEGLSDVYVVDNKFAPVDPATNNVLGTTGWHSHPGPSLIHVVAGTITNYSGHDPRCTPHRYNAGQGFIDSGSDVHILRNEGLEPAETIAVQLLPKDAVRRIDVPQAPGNCPF